MLLMLKQILVTQIAKIVPCLKKWNHRIPEIIYKHLGLTRFKIEGADFYLNPISTLDRALILYGGYDNFVIENVLKHLGPSDVCIDIGANIGYVSILAAVKTGALVYAFEPSSRELSRLFLNLHANPGARVAVFPVALAAADGSTELFIAPIINPGKNALMNRSNPNLTAEVVPQFRFDSLFPSQLLHRVKIIKIDVEGAEMQVLEGMRQSMERLNGAIIIIEITPKLLKRFNNTAAEIYSLFASCGFHSHFGMKDEVQYNEMFEKVPDA